MPQATTGIGNAVGNATADLFAPVDWTFVTVDGKRRRKCQWKREDGTTCPATAVDTKQQIEKHWRTHTGEKPHACPHKGCGKSFTQLVSLANHVRTHTGEKPFQCTECPKAFAQTGHLTAHVRAKHTFEKPFKCEECTKAFAQSSQLTDHVRTHTGEKPHSCPHEGCGKAFTQSSQLTTHMRTHTKEKPYSCKECSMAFTQSGTLATHVRVMHGGELQTPCKGDKTSGTCQLGRSGLPQYDWHCVRCFCTNWPNSVRAINAKKYLHAKELTVRAFLEAVFPKYRWVFDRCHAVGVLVRPDAKAAISKNRLLIVEIDEYSHNTYDCTKERDRELILAKHAPRGCTIHLIRFNPDEYDDPVTGKRVPSCFKRSDELNMVVVDPARQKDWDARLATLKATIDEIVLYKHEAIAVPKCVLTDDRYKFVIPIELFYDNVREKWPDGRAQKLAAWKRNAQIQKVGSKRARESENENESGEGE
tara:strand:+ start:3260 stop:4687 length:1428 start_codon:yes stop_codon:yes gene_type:complete